MTDPIFPPEWHGRQRVILVDPPWKFRVRSPKGEDRSASNHYEVMTPEEIAAMPVGTLAAKNCALLLWATWPFLPEALMVIGTWGFAYKTCGFVFAKTNKNGDIRDEKGQHMGNGFYTRANTEPCLLATRGGKLRCEDGKDVRQLIVEDVREHSRKPDDLHPRIERLFDGPYCELFAREPRPGWNVWGNETDRFAA